MNNAIMLAYPYIKDNDRAQQVNIAGYNSWYPYV